MQDSPILPIDAVVTSFYLRLQVADEAGVLARITGILAEHGISIDALLQRPNAAGEARTDVIILTPRHRRGPDDQRARRHAGPADGAGEDRSHPQGRAGVKYLSTRGEAAGRGFTEILLEGLAPDGGLYVPERYPRIDAATLARMARAARTRSSRSRSCRSTSTTSPPADLREIVCRTYTRRGLRRRAHHAAARRSSPASSSSASRTARRSRSRTSRCSSLGNALRVRARAPRRHAQRARRDLGRHRQRRRACAAGQARDQGLHALARTAA